MSNSPYSLRKAIPSDAANLAALHVQTFIETHGIPGPSVQVRKAQWASILLENENSFCLVVESPTGLVGFSRGIERNDPTLHEYKGELNKIYLLREVQRQGLGRRLLRASAQEFRILGISSMLLFGDASNPSNGFYEHMGGERLYSESGEFHGGYGWKHFDQLLFNPANPQIHR